MQSLQPKFLFKEEECPRSLYHGAIRMKSYGWCARCGYLWKERGVIVQAPKIKWKPLPSYELKNLPLDFKIAEFERRASEDHINKMVQSMLANVFYDTIIRVVVTDCGPSLGT